MKISDFERKTPILRIEDYFDGRTKAWGIFEDRFGTLRREFTVDITGVRDGGTITLTEDFQYADGETERRIWVIKRTGDGTYEGTADGVVGTASGASAGNALHWKYAFDLNVDGDIWRVAFDDWLFLQPGDVVVNRATVSRWGFTIGQVTLFFSKEKKELNGTAFKHRSGVLAAAEPAQ